VNLLTTTEQQASVAYPEKCFLGGGGGGYYARIFFRWGSTNSVEDRGQREIGDLGAVAP
jgi:hypothetical protein